MIKYKLVKYELPFGKNEADILPPPELSGVDWQPIQMSHTASSTSILWRGSTFLRGVGAKPSIKKASIPPAARKVVLPPPLPPSKK